MNNLALFFSSLRWQDILDITINSYILFRLYVLFRGTTTFRVMLGLAFLWFFQRIAVATGLVVTSWVIQRITAAAAIIIIVIFRNEIRNVFQAKNIRTILWGIPHPPESDALEVITETVFDMAQTRIGALLVFPGKEDLTESVRGGIRWEGLISKEMIKTIFWHNNPVHDGAAVIDGRRVTHVAGILPLSQRVDLPSYYGTRHRAAAGLAETTDALIVVVSEERGQVVVAKGAQLTPVRSAKELTAMLREHTGTPELPEGHKRRINMSVAMAALASVVFISGVWFSFTRGTDTLITLEVPIKFLNLQPNMEIVNSNVSSVRLNLNGAAALMQSLRPDQVQVKVDLRRGVVGNNQVQILPDNVSVPPGILINRIDPNTVNIMLDAQITREIPVQADWSGKLADNLIMTDVGVEPKMLRVNGRSLFLKDIKTIYTKRIDLDVIVRSGKTTVQPVLESPLKLVEGEPNFITVFYKVQARN